MSLAALILGLLCLGAILFLLAIAVVLWLQNRQEERGNDTADVDFPLQRRLGAAPAFSSYQTEADLEGNITDLLSRGRKVEAVKIYRQATGLELKEAKEAVEAIASGALSGYADLASLQAQSTAGWMKQAKALLQAGNKIEAIKLYREMTGVGLKEAKEAIDEMERENQ